MSWQMQILPRCWRDMKLGVFTAERSAVQNLTIVFREAEAETIAPVISNGFVSVAIGLRAI